VYIYKHIPIGIFACRENLKLKTILLHIHAKDIKNGNYDKEGGPLSETDVEDVKTTPS
jgi:hypothetical protein